MAVALHAGARHRFLACRMLDRFYLIVDERAWLARLLPHGVRLAQLRVKDLPEAELRAQIRARARSLRRRRRPARRQRPLARSRSTRAATTSISARTTSTDADLAAIRRAGLKLGISTHDDAELDSALRRAPDYVALGPIYPTTLKEMRLAPQGLAKLTLWKERIGSARWSPSAASRSSAPPRRLPPAPIRLRW